MKLKGRRQSSNVEDNRPKTSKSPNLGIGQKSLAGMEKIERQNKAANQVAKSKERTRVSIGTKLERSKVLRKQVKEGLDRLEKAQAERRKPRSTQ